MRQSMPDAFQKAELPTRAGYSALCPMKQFEEEWQEQPVQNFEELNSDFKKRVSEEISVGRAKNTTDAERILFNSYNHHTTGLQALMGTTPKKIREMWWRKAGVIVGGEASSQAQLLKHQALSFEEWECLEGIALEKIEKAKTNWNAHRWLVGSVKLRGWMKDSHRARLIAVSQNAQVASETAWMAVGALVWTEDFMAEELLAMLQEQLTGGLAKTRERAAGFMLSAFVHHPKANVDLWREILTWSNAEGLIALACHDRSRREPWIRLGLGNLGRFGGIYGDKARGITQGWLSIEADDDSFWRFFSQIVEYNVTDAVELLKRRAKEGPALDAVTLSYIMTHYVTVQEPQLRQAAIGLLAKATPKTKVQR